VKEGISQMSRANNRERKGFDQQPLGDAFCPRSANRGSDGEFFKISDVIPGYSYVNVSVMKSFRFKICRSREKVKSSESSTFCAEWIPSMTD
jgi:hypothetical protein